MEASLGKLFAGLLIFNTVRLFLPFPTRQDNGGPQIESGQFWKQVNYWYPGPDANGASGTSDNQYNLYAYKPDPTGVYAAPYVPGQGAFPPLLSSIVFTAGIVIPSVIVYKKGGNFLTVFGIGVIGWTIAKLLQTTEMKPHGSINYTPGTRPEDFNNYVRLMKYWQQVFEITAWGTMASAFLTIDRTPVPVADDLVSKVFTATAV